jgi:hypothetical protein
MRPPWHPRLITNSFAAMAEARACAWRGSLQQQRALIDGVYAVNAGASGPVATATDRGQRLSRRAQGGSARRLLDPRGRVVLEDETRFHSRGRCGAIRGRLASLPYGSDPRNDETDGRAPRAHDDGQSLPDPPAQRRRNEGPVIAAPRQKRLALGEQVTFSANEQRNRTIFRFKARDTLDLGTTYNVTDADGRPIGRFKKEFRKTLTRATWHMSIPWARRRSGRHRAQQRTCSIRRNLVLEGPAHVVRDPRRRAVPALPWDCALGVTAWSRLSGIVAWRSTRPVAHLR